MNNIMNHSKFDTLKTIINMCESKISEYDNSNEAEKFKTIKTQSNILLENIEETELFLKELINDEQNRCWELYENNDNSNEVFRQDRRIDEYKFKKEELYKEIDIIMKLFEDVSHFTGIEQKSQNDMREEISVKESMKCELLRF